MIYIYTLAILYVFWLTAIASLNLYRGWLTGKMTRAMPAYWLAVPTMVAFVLLDWVMNRTVFTLICFELPHDNKELVTQRMARYRTQGANKWRVGVADFVCGLLNLFNYSADNHC